ncbi:MAG: HNH endonuclease signature motif containing protein [Elusimicrobia bacterium]|nr:HNH endonuclease signature motif containing protein [Elusimicrobiota bacterium]
MEIRTMHAHPALRILTDDDLLARLDILVREERDSLAEVVEHLMEVERRELALDRGYASLYEYCVKALGYSQAAAFLRIRAARAAAEFPEIIDRLRSGRVHLDAIARLYPHLTCDNSARLLDRVEGASKQDVLALVAALQTVPPPVKDLIVPVPATPKPVGTAPGDPKRSSDGGAAVPPTAAEPEVIPPPLHRFHFTGDGELLSLVARLRQLLRHKHPEGRLEDIFKEAARTLLEDMERELRPAKIPAKRSLTRTVPAARSNGSRYVPRTVKRAVWKRDGGRCAYVAPDGRRCESRGALEYDHIVPWADGGRSDTADNIRLLCRAHNQRLGRKRFGGAPTGAWRLG